MLFFSHVFVAGVLSMLMGEFQAMLGTLVAYVMYAPASIFLATLGGFLSKQVNAKCTQ